VTSCSALFHHLVALKIFAVNVVVFKSFTFRAYSEFHPEEEGYKFPISSYVQIGRLLGATRGENRWVPNLVNVTDRVTPAV
jgi:hypothetical protein